ncbi:hypothetical protein AB1Y20_007385 [Prymnesium parvum]|uniref:J domain-containing protein n=1 Tax=Prymnesium parvum TaxID=97485 RepID=A0AB34IV24_PRYPA
MSSRNAIDLFDPEVARRHTQAELRAKMGGPVRFDPGRLDPSITASVQAKIMEALAIEGAKIRAREEERRKRDPTYRADAIDLSTANLKAYDKYVDYYARLEVDEFASALELKKAYMRLSLQLHPDKQSAATPAEAAALSRRFHEMTEAYEVLSDLPTRRQYDRERDKLDADSGAGLVDSGRMEKPPPTCVDVHVTLAELYRGVVKHVEFERKDFAGTKWERKSYASYLVKVNRGEYEGATVWFREEGDRGPFGKSDLVFVVKEVKHPTFERVGDDLWYMHPEAARAEQLLWAALVPTLTGEVALACGHTLFSLLGYDHSGVGEAIVDGCGMPLRDGTDASLRKSRGDLVVKFPITPPRGARRVLVTGLAPLPPLVLLTSCAGALRTQPLAALLATTVLPHFLARAAYDLSTPPPLHLRPPHSHRTPPHAVCLLLGKPAAAAAAAAGPVAQLRALLSHCIPRLAWRVLVAPRGLAACLLDDEASALASAAFVLVALPDEPRAPHEARAPPAAWRVAHRPAVRVRRAAASGAAVVGRVRAGEVVRGVLQPDGWLRLAPEGGAPRFVQTRPSAAEAAAWRASAEGRRSEEGATAPADSAAKSGAAPPLLVPAHPEDLTEDRDGLDSDAEEDDLPPQHLRRLDEEYLMYAPPPPPHAANPHPSHPFPPGCPSLRGSCREALEVLHEDAAAALHECHCRGGVIFAIDSACSLFGQPLAEQRPPPRREAHRAGAAPRAATISWPHLLDYHVGIQPPLDRDGHVSWRRLRGAASQAGLADGAHNFVAVGLPAGSVVAVLTAQRNALRPALGSAPPRKYSHRELQAWRARRDARKLRRRVEAERSKVLRELSQLESHGFAG